ncbi:ABC transporter permease [Nakamurella flavida]|uniref:ABC transporter permease n=1 Tax=Nakamurella flavida TaxID=363630 RepID=A0A938YLF7_9ACTN|nr:ABC transporter permease [Nakamurella flavida]MBM9475193.1 ABC transporter permease [Nakamurella flavida]MDP9776766.1 peptide/nickel transport system permease protein [Nakamurella flavida]
MTWPLLRRVGIFLLSVLVASVAVFALLTVLGDPARTALGTGATDEAVAALRTRFGLDRSLVTQYLDWAGGILHGDFGVSYVSGVPIGPQIADRLAVTLWLVAGAVVVSLVVAVPCGVLAAVRRGRPEGTLVSVLSQVGVAVPAFLAGLLLVTVFAVTLGWLPANGYRVPAQDPGGFLAHMVLPWLSLGLVQGAVLTRYVRSAVLDELNQDYLRTARSTGLTTMQAVVRHGLRNAALPVLTVLGVQLVTVLVGAVVVERVFVIPGIGSWLADSVGRQDLLAVQGIVLVLVVFALAVSFLVDVAAAALDPRVRRG